jgi:hypothetical protein
VFTLQHHKLSHINMVSVNGSGYKLATIYTILDATTGLWHKTDPNSKGSLSWFSTWNRATERVYVS